MAHAQGGREQRDRLSRRRARRQQRDDGRRLRAEQEAVQGLPGRRAAQARPQRRRPADLARVLERRRQPDRDASTRSPTSRTSPTGRPSTSSRSATRRRSPQSTRDELRRASTESGFGYAPIPSFDFAEASIDLSALGIEPAARASRAATCAAAPADRRPARSSRTRLRPFPIDLNNCGKVTIIKNAVPNDAAGLRLHDDRRRAAGELQPRQRRRRRPTRCRTPRTFELVSSGRLHRRGGDRRRLGIDRLDLRRQGNSTGNTGTRHGHDQGRRQRARHVHVRQHEARHDHRREADRT